MNKETFRIELEVKTPLFIGSGIKYKRHNYINDFKNKRLYILDEIKWIDFLANRDALDLFMNYVNKAGPRMDIREFLHENRSTFRLKTLDTAFESISSHIMVTAHLEKMNNNDIDAFIKNYMGDPYIPGSSIKGAIGNAIIKHLIKKNPEQTSFFKSNIDAYSKTRRLDRSVKNKLNGMMDYSRQINNKNEIFKGMAGIQVSDSNSFSKKNLKIYRKVDVAPRHSDDQDPGERNNQRSSIPLFRECADTGTIVSFALGIDYQKINPEYGINSINDLMKIINEGFEMVYGKDGIVSEYQLINQFLPESFDGQILIQLGGGAGFHSKTAISSLNLSRKERNDLTAKVLSVRAPKHKHDKGVKVISPRCLKIVNVKSKKMLMGICSLKQVQE